MSTPKAGRVYLAGAGPGDPGLLTARALELIATADVILYDRLIGASVLDGARADAELLFVEGLAACGLREGGESLAASGIDVVSGLRVPIGVEDVLVGRPDVDEDGRDSRGSVESVGCLLNVELPALPVGQDDCDPMARDGREEVLCPERPQ